MVLLVLPLLLLVACAAPVVATPMTLLPTVTFLPSSSPLPSQTARPTNTEIPTPKTTAELEPTIPAVIVSAMQTLNAVPDTTCGTAKSKDDSSLSSNGQWVAVQCRLSSTTTLEITTRVFRLDGSASWDVSFDETYGRFHGWNDGRMQLYHWSKDGNFAYLIPSFCCVDVPQNIFFNGFRTGVGLYRLDLQTGKLAVVLPPSPTSVVTGYAFSFSPNDKYLAYLGPNNLNEINVYTLKSGSVEKIGLNRYDFCGGFEWSADSKKLAFVCVLYESEDKQIYAYLWLDTADWVPNLLTKKEAAYPENAPGMRWTEDNHLIVNP